VYLNRLGAVPKTSQPCLSAVCSLCCLFVWTVCSILSWAIAVMAGLFAVQTLGINIQPLLAVGGASSLIIGLATQTLLTNAVMGVSIFLSRPFVPGDSITVQAAGAILVSGVVEKVTPMRTLLRTDDDVLVTLPNKVRLESESVELQAQESVECKACGNCAVGQHAGSITVPKQKLASVQPHTCLMVAQLKVPWMWNL